MGILHGFKLAIYSIAGIVVVGICYALTILSTIFFTVLGLIAILATFIGLIIYGAYEYVRYLIYGEEDT